MKQWSKIHPQNDMLMAELRFAERRAGYSPVVENRKKTGLEIE